jgi:hypothetical protein
MWNIKKINQNHHENREKIELIIFKEFSSIWNAFKDPRWRLEGGSRQHELCKSKIFLKCWSHTWQKKKQEAKLWNPDQPVKSCSMPHYTEKTGGLTCCQTPAPKVLWRYRPTDEQISSMQYSHSYPWDKPA